MVGSRAIIIGDMKRCNQCLRFMSFDNFTNKKARCKNCLNENMADWVRKNPDKIAIYRVNSRPFDLKRNKARRETHIGKMKTLCNAAKTRAKMANLDFDLTWQFLHVMLVCQNFCCSQTGIEFDFSTEGTTKKIRKLIAPSIDRKENNKGYTFDNVQIVCWFYNAAKGTSDDKTVWDLMRQAVAFGNAK